MSQYLLAVDPGKTTGIALIEITQDEEPKIIWSRETSPEETEDLVNLTLYELKGHDLRVVCESFIITPQTGRNSQAPWSLELIGVVKYLTRAHGFGAPVMQSPQRAKKFVSNDRLRDLNFWHRGGSGHARDALRHAVLYLVDQGWRPENLLRK